MHTIPMLASVDLGSNSFRLQICQNHNGRLQVIENIKHMVRLAGGLDENKNLDAASQERALACLAQFGERLRGFAPEHVRAVATNTFRVAKNIADFHPKAEAALGFPIEIIAGREEARLIYTGVIHTYPANGRKLLIIDIGGGSTEFILGSSEHPTHTESLPLGCVTHSKRFFGGKIGAKDFQAAVHAARSEIQRISKLYKRQGWDTALGTSGTAKAIATVIEAEKIGQGITLDAMRRLAERICAAGSVKKAHFAGLKSERVEVFAGGLAVMTAAFEELDIDRMAYNDAALRDGLFYDLIGRDVNKDMREQTAVEFQERYRVSKNQAQRVWHVADTLFAGMMRGAGAGETEYWAQYLRWAAMLHEVGLSIAHTAYHKHSAYILAQADMPGFSRHEQRILSAFVLGQRGDLKKMDELSHLSDTEWNAVMALRLAVLFCRGRLPVELPAQTGLSRCGSRGLRLAISGGWLDNNPMTSAALQQESAQWRNLGRKFELELI